MPAAGKAAAAKIRILEIQVGLDTSGNFDAAAVVALNRNFEHAVRSRDSSAQFRQLVKVGMNRDLAVSRFDRSDSKNVSG